MDPHEFPHELNPELRRQAVLDNERERLALELERSKVRLFARLRRFFLLTSPVPLIAALMLGSPSGALAFGFWALIGVSPPAMAIVALSVKIARARGRLELWNQIVTDAVKDR